MEGPAILSYSCPPHLSPAVDETTVCNSGLLVDTALRIKAARESDTLQSQECRLPRHSAGLRLITKAGCVTDHNGTVVSGDCHGRAEFCGLLEVETHYFAPSPLQSLEVRSL